MLAVGLVLPVLLALGMSAQTGLALGVAAGVLLLCWGASFFRVTRIAVPVAAVVGVAGWVAFGGGLALLQELWQVFLLELQGMHGVLPLYATPVACGLGAVAALLAWIMCLRCMGPLPGWLAVILLSVLCWQQGDIHLVVAAAPAVAAVLVLTIRSMHPAASIGKNLAMMLCCTLLAGCLIPAEGIVIAPLQEQAQALRQKILDTLFFTEARDVFSLAKEGYYPQGQTQLGGTPNPSNHLVMVVQTPKKVYLRAISRDSYTGRSWEDTTGGRRYQWMLPQWWATRSQVFDQELPAKL